MDVNDPATFAGPFGGEILAAYQRVLSGGGQAAVDELNTLLVKRQQASTAPPAETSSPPTVGERSATALRGILNQARG